MATAVGSLPELITRIVAFVANDHPSTLHAAALVSKAWLTQGHVQREIFDHPKLGRIEDWHRLLRTLQSTKHLRPLVRSLTLAFEEERLRFDDDDFHLESTLSSAEVSSLFPATHKVEFRGLDPSLLSLLSAFKKLKTLTIFMPRRTYRQDGLGLISAPTCALEEFNLDLVGTIQSPLIDWLSKTPTANTGTLRHARLSIQQPSAATEIQEFVQQHSSLDLLTIWWMCGLLFSEWCHNMSLLNI
jgi:hypothetical protein